MIPETTMLTFEEICERGRAESESLDEKRFKLGDLGNLIQTAYGEHSIDEFAKEINQGKSTCYQYATVARFYPPEVRTIIKETYPNISYSHMRDSMRLGDIMAATEWLNEVSTNGYTVDEASRKLTESLGRETRESAEGTIFCYAGQIDGKFIIEIAISEQDVKWLKDADRVVIRAK